MVWICLISEINCRQEIVLLDNEISFNEAMIEERDQGLREIEEQIGEANEIFKDLAVLVHDQGIVIGKKNSIVKIEIYIVSSLLVATKFRYSFCSICLRGFGR
jgi:hypothetical protein